MPFVGTTMEAEWIPKLYMVSRADLPPGVQACQAMHAMREFVNDHPELEAEWYESSNHVAFLSASSLTELHFYVQAAEENNIKHSTFFEPDLENELTAACFSPTIESRELLSSLSTALKTKRKNWW